MQSVMDDNQDIMQIIHELERRIERLEQTNAELLEIIHRNHLIINEVPVNRSNWVSESPTKWELTENGETYYVESSTTYQNQVRCSPHNLFTKSEGEVSEWATDEKWQNDSWVRIKYPRKTKCNYFRIKARAQRPEQAPSNFEIRGTDDHGLKSGTYNVLAKYENIKFVGNETKEFRFVNEVKYSSYYLFVYTNNGSPCTEISEYNMGYIY